MICMSDRLIVKNAHSDHAMHYRRVIVHELAHMWFGNLVTMVWWNDLWLKESFADFSAATCLAECETLKNDYPEWIHYPLIFTEKALGADLQPWTHPIAAEIDHTGEGENVFDMISYAKGACWVRVLDNYVGRPVLKRGMQMYFDKFANSNTEIHDLVSCINDANTEINGEEEFGKTTLMSWTDQWLKSQGPNTLIVQRDRYSPEKLNIRQDFGSLASSMVYRSQKLDILLFGDQPDQ